MGAKGKARAWTGLLGRSWRKPLVVFTPAKVGTTSLTQSSWAVAHRLALHLHFVTPEGADRFVKYPPVVQKDRHQVTASYYRLLVRPRRSVKVVTVVRDPLSHAVSLFFNFGPRLGYFPAIDEQDTADVEPVLDNFVEFFLGGGPVGLCFNGDSDWFRDEFEVATGCDVYGQEFDADRGYQFFEAGKFSILLLKFERLAEVAPAAMQQLLDLPAPLPLGHKHSTDDKGYGTLYQRFKAETVMPPEVLERACGSKYASHFYSTDELERFAARWS